MNTKQKIMIGIGIVLIAIQFIRPAKNTSSQLLVTDISKTVKISDSVQAVFKKACYDCHSNNTNYPWYAFVEPIGWFLAGDISDGKRSLNFSEFGKYSLKRQSGKRDDIADVIRDDHMPLSSYKLMHKNGRLSPQEKSLLIKWAQQK